MARLANPAALAGRGKALDGSIGGDWRTVRVVEQARMGRWIGGLVLRALLALGIGSTPTVAGAAQRIALVIGNQAYSEAPLFNPVNDARAVGASLEALGFEVVLATDVGLDAMQTAFVDFVDRIDEGATAMIFYAGHGVQVRGRNYLVPVDAELATERSTRFEALDVADLLEELEYSGAKIRLVVLDACRNNPFGGRLRGASRGLAAIDAAAGTLIAYATAPGSVASDGSGGHGLYTEQLLAQLRRPGLQVEELFKQVRIAVSELSDGEQIPWESSSLTGDFVFNHADPAASTETAAPDATAAAAAPVPPTDDGAGSGPKRDTPPPRGCEDLSGAWTVRNSMRACATRATIARKPDGGYAGDEPGCGLTALVRARYDAQFEDPVFRVKWQAGPCAGTTEYVMEPGCQRGSGAVTIPNNLLGVCGPTHFVSDIERVAAGR